jgi:hypothetical protein
MLGVASVHRRRGAAENENSTCQVREREGDQSCAESSELFRNQRSIKPFMTHPNVYGIDMPSTAELIACSRSESEVERKIGADWLVYQDLEDLKDSISAGNPALTDFDCSFFDGRYVAADIDQADIDRLAVTRRGGPTGRIACPPSMKMGVSLRACARTFRRDHIFFGHCEQSDLL